jgi:hypothetical protein
MSLDAVLGQARLRERAAGVGGAADTPVVVAGCHLPGTSSASGSGPIGTNLTVASMISK